MSALIRWLALVTVMCGVRGLVAADRTLIEFGADFKVAGVGTTDAEVTAGTGMLRVLTHHQAAWPGVTLKAPHGAWNLANATMLTTHIKNPGKEELKLSMRLDNPGADGKQKCLTRQLTVKAGGEADFDVPLPYKSNRFAPVKLFGMRGYPLEMPQGESTLDPTNVTQLLFFVTRPQQDYAFEIGAIRVAEQAPVAANTPPEKFLPFIDTFGQYVHRDWPGKVHSLAELKEHQAAEERDLQAQPGPDTWDQYGGDKSGPKLEVTGFFRVQKHAGKWWFVDPAGHLFWSHGIDSINAWHNTPLDDRADWFQDFPGDRPEFKEFLKSGQKGLIGYYKGRTVKSFGFYGANLKRKFGDAWRDSFTQLVHRRLRSWGLNTVGNWSDREVCLARRTPYVATVGSGGKYLEGSEGYWGQFRDVFDPSFAEAVTQNVARQKNGAAGDPWCLGFFVDNEIAWGDDISLAVATLRSPATQAAKGVLLADLKTKYGSIEQLNTAWGTDHASWQALLDTKTAPDTKNKTVRADLGAFYTKFAEKYFEVCRQAVKQAAPQQLYLGCRFAWVNDRAVLAATKYCDVISYNLYRRSIADFKSPATELPIIVGEWHLGALDRGQFHTGLVPVKSQTERAAVYRDYITGALRHPQIVGCHWFEFADEPATGRTLDGENYQIGFVDVTDTPYPETIAAAREMGAKLYQLRSGQ